MTWGIRAVMAWPVALAVTAVAAVTAVVARRRSASPRAALRVARRWARLCLRLTGCRLAVEGEEHLAPGRPVVLLANHRSALDILALLAAVPVEQEVLFWAKQSLFRVPLLGRAMRALDFLPVDRVRRLRTAAMFGTTLELVRRGRSPLVFPEETYGPGDRLLPFKRGAFLLAIRAGLAIVPVGVAGTARAMPPGARLVRPARLCVRFGTPIPAGAGRVSSRPEVERRTRAALEHLSREA